MIGSVIGGTRLLQFALIWALTQRQSHPHVQHGASPRSYHHLLSLARTAAFFEGHDYLLPEDVKAVVIDCWQHRLIRTIQAEAENVTSEEILREVLDRTPIP